MGRTQTSTSPHTHSTEGTNKSIRTQRLLFPSTCESQSLQGSDHFLSSASSPRIQAGRGGNWGCGLGGQRDPPSEPFPLSAHLWLCLGPSPFPVLKKGLKMGRRGDCPDRQLGGRHSSGQRRKTAELRFLNRLVEPCVLR